MLPRPSHDYGVTLSADDTFKIAVKDDEVKYYHITAGGAETVLYTSKKTPSYPLFVDTALATPNAAITSMSIDTKACTAADAISAPAVTTAVQDCSGSHPVTWGRMYTTYEATANGGLQKKADAAKGWIDDAVALQTIPKKSDTVTQGIKFKCDVRSDAFVGLSRYEYTDDQARVDDARMPKLDYAWQCVDGLAWGVPYPDRNPDFPKGLFTAHEKLCFDAVNGLYF